MGLLEQDEKAQPYDQSEKFGKMVAAYSKMTGKKSFGLSELYR